MKSYTSNIGELNFISPTMMRNFIEILNPIDGINFKCNEHTFESAVEYLKTLSNKDDETKEWKIFLPTLNDEHIGITGWYIFNDSVDIAWLTWFGIIKKYQHCHLGSELLRHTINTIKEETDCDKLYVYCIDDVVEFYKKNGFKFLGKAIDVGLENKCEDDDDNILVFDLDKLRD